MWLKEASAECCNEYSNMSKDTSCYIKDICQEIEELMEKHKRAFVNRPRLMQMAIPLRRKKLFKPTCACPFKRPIELVHLDQRENTRTDQLAYPTVRRLLLFRTRVLNLFPRERVLKLNRLIRKSLFSMYSRLSNAQPPEEKHPIPKWSKGEWKKHTKTLRKLAVPKVPPEQPEIVRESKPLEALKRFKYLADPKVRPEFVKQPWVLTPAHKAHKASDRTNVLAKPIIRDDKQVIREFDKISPGALKHKASKRTTELAQPNARRTAKSAPSDTKENAFTISPIALKHKASKRTQELAEPKEYENKHIREDPYKISPKALKAKAKPRTIELAQPKKH